MEQGIRRVFQIVTDAVLQEADRVRGYPTAAPLYRYAGLTGLAARGEAHLTAAIARCLGNAGHATFIDEPYPVEHKSGRIKRFDLKVVLEQSGHPYSARFLTLEVKRFTMIDGAMGSMLADARKLHAILEDEHRLLNIPIGMLLIGFSHNERDDWHRRRYASFERRAGFSQWLHLTWDAPIAPEGEPMRVCMIDMWCYNESLGG